MAAREPYRTHRQQHLGDFLDFLQAQGWLSWEWGNEESPTIFYIAERGAPPKAYRTWEAESVVQRIADREGLLWLPVPYPGGLDHYNETLARINLLSDREHGDPPQPDGDRDEVNRQRDGM